MTAGAPTLGGLNRLQNPRFKNVTVTGDVTIDGVLTAGSIASGGDIVLGNGESIKTDTTTGHTATFQAYDVNGTAYKNFATLTNGDTPSFAIAAPSGGTVAIDGAVIGGTTPAAGTFTTMTASTSVLGAATGTSASLTGGYVAKSGTAAPASAGAVAAGVPLSLFSNGIGIYVTTDAPAFSAVKGSLCIALDGSSSSTRLFINNGTTNWIAVTTAS